MSVGRGTGPEDAAWGQDFLDDLARQLQRAAGTLAMVIGIVVLLGWMLGIEAVKRVDEGMTAMQPNTAVGLILLGAALRALELVETERRRQPRLGRTAILAALAAAAIGAATLVEILAGVDLRIDGA